MSSRRRWNGAWRSAKEFGILIGKEGGEKMNKMTMDIEWPQLGITVTAESLDYNQRFSAKFWECLPFETVQLHAMVTGEDMYAYSPVSPLEHKRLAEVTNLISDLPVGQITWSILGLVAIVYGPCTEPLATRPIALIPEKDHTRLKQAGREAWNSIYFSKEPLRVVFRKRGR
jgi:hypothetical protein